ncbi:hypothetical protein [Pseudaestuariivita atlantica]|uniref:hypothetical protein n=1 Tax=Pseudaestuariivita atlantica TaxID=1317121 RepID=UPI00067E40CC|nr:hypothetical protein [Pseudaestuariivita atlantica]
MHPADELGQVRAEIARLTAREAQLKATLAMQRRDLSGARYKAEFKPVLRRVFLRDKLPSYIREAPDLWEARTSLQLRLHPMAVPVEEEDDDATVIELWQDDGPRVHRA